MGDFRRQPSKVWWSTYEDENFSKYSRFLDWGKGVDLSGNLCDAYNNNNSISTIQNNSVITKLDESKLSKSVDQKQKPSTTKHDEEEEEEEEIVKENQIESMDSNRGSSSSPSQGSHKSQDSGFSDSEIQNNAQSLSPQCSPELSARLNCNKCNSLDGSKVEELATSQKEKIYDNTVVSYRKLKTSIKTAQYKVVEFDPESYNEKETKYLETAFDREETPKKENKDVTKEPSNTIVPSVNAAKELNRKSLIMSQISRTKTDTIEKINQIHNHLESTLKLPKKMSLSQNLKLPNLFHQKPLADSQNTKAPTTSSIKTKGFSTSSLRSQKLLLPIVSAEDKAGERIDNLTSESLDAEGFKVPKFPTGSNNFLDLTELGGPPVSTSTPKSSKFHGRESPLPKTARATEKKYSTKTTFATIRKLKGSSDKKQKGNANLVGSFNRCANAKSIVEKPKINLDIESSLSHWVAELETMYEAEIMTTLQSKSLATDLTRQVTNMAHTTSATVRTLHQKTKTISSEFSKLCQQNKNKVEKNVAPLVQSLVGHIIEFINEYVQKPQTVSLSHKKEPINSKSNFEDEKSEIKSSTGCHEMITDFRKPEPETVEMMVETAKKTKEEEVLEACENLRKFSMQAQYDQNKIEVDVMNLGQKFKDVVDSILESHIQALVRVLEEPKTELALRTALSALTTLGLEGNQLCELVSKCGGIRALLAVCLEARATAVRVSALRALATICCVSATIRQFEQAGGVEIIADILSDNQRSEIELSEASAVIAQITAPWVQDNHCVDGLRQFLNSLVSSLTRIISNSNSSDTLLLSSAALANLTFMEPRTVWPLLEYKTGKILLSAVRRQGSKVSVFIQEQAAIVIANMASVPECRKHLAEQRAVVGLLCFLEIHHSPLQGAPEVAAAERVLQKSAIALSRLCSDSAVAKQVVELKGVNRLVRLCKEESERNHSDGVLVACLAALRKIVANCGTEPLQELDAMELVEPRLLDSFLLYSSKQESYV